MEMGNRLSKKRLMVQSSKNSFVRNSSAITLDQFAAA